MLSYTIPYRRITKAITGGLVLCLLCSLLGVTGQAQGVREDVVRLHILANSDSTADQTLKLQVRDAVVAATAGWQAETPEMARTTATQDLPHIREIAQQVVADAGYDYPVEVELTRMYFTTRQYGEVTLPAGMYDAVRVTLGEGKGQNWWCVVYPPLCVGAATEGTDRLDTPQQAFVAGDDYQVRFKVVEWVESFFEIFRKKV